MNRKRKNRHPQIAKAAASARLPVDAANASDFEKVKARYAAMANVDSTSLEPHNPNPLNVWREDVVTPSMTQEETLLNAPKVVDGLFFVPPVMEAADAAEAQG